MRKYSEKMTRKPLILHRALIAAPGLLSRLARQIGPDLAVPRPGVEVRMLRIPEEQGVTDAILGHDRDLFALFDAGRVTMTTEIMPCMGQLMGQCNQRIGPEPLPVQRCIDWNMLDQRRIPEERIHLVVIIRRSMCRADPHRSTRRLQHIEFVGETPRIEKPQRLDRPEQAIAIAFGRRVHTKPSTDQPTQLIPGVQAYHCSASTKLHVAWAQRSPPMKHPSVNRSSIAPASSRPRNRYVTRPSDVSSALEIDAPVKRDLHPSRSPGACRGSHRTIGVAKTISSRANPCTNRDACLAISAHILSAKMPLTPSPLAERSARRPRHVHPRPFRSGPRSFFQVRPSDQTLQKKHNL